MSFILEINQNTQPNTKGKIKFAWLLYLFPIGAIPIRHWISFFFLLFAIYSLKFTWKNYKQLRITREEKYLFIAYGVYFALYIVSMLIHGWYDAWAVEIKYLLALPIYFLIRSTVNAQSWLIRGSIIANHIIFISTLYEITIGHLDNGRAGSVYGPLFMGPVAVLTCFVAISSYQGLSTKYWRIAAILTFPLTIYSMIGADSRSAYVAFCVLAIYVIATHLCNWRQKTIVVAFVFASLFVIFTTSETFHHSTLRVAENIQNIWKKKKPDYQELAVEHFDSGVERYLLWVAAVAIIKDHPILGIGYGHFQQTAQDYVDKGLLGSFPYHMGHGHAHNIFLETYLEKGLFGFVNLLTLFILMFYLLHKYRSNDHVIYLTGVGIVIAIIAFGMFEAAPINKNNFSAVFMIYVLTFIASLAQKRSPAAESPIVMA